jgi:hypothetical protein
MVDGFPARRLELSAAIALVYTVGGLFLSGTAHR